MSNQLIPQNFEMFSGDDKNIQFTITDEDNAASDITGASATWACSRRVKTSTLISKTVGSGITIVSGVGGVLLVSLAQADTASLRGDYYHELEIVDAAGKKTTAAYGTMTVLTDHIP